MAETLSHKNDSLKLCRCPQKRSIKAPVSLCIPMQTHSINVKITLLLQLLSPSASSHKRNFLHLLSTCFLGIWTAKSGFFSFVQCDSVPPSLVIAMHLHQCQKNVYSAGVFSKDAEGTSLFNTTLAFHKTKVFLFLCCNRKYNFLTSSWYISSKRWSIYGILRRIHSQKLLVSEFVFC